MPNIFTTRLSQRLFCFGNKPLDISPTPLRQHDIGSRSNLTTIQSDDEAETEPKRPPNSFRQAAQRVRQRLHENTITNTALFPIVGNAKHTAIIVEGIKSTALMEQRLALTSKDMSQKQKRSIPINPADTQVSIFPLFYSRCQADVYSRRRYVSGSIRHWTELRLPAKNFGTEGRV